MSLVGKFVCFWVSQLKGLDLRSPILRPKWLQRLHALLMAWWRSGRHIPESDYEQMLLRRLSVGHWFVGCSIRYVFLFLSLRLHGWVCKLITITTDCFVWGVRGCGARFVGLP